MADRTIRRPTSNAEYIYNMSRLDLVRMLHGFCENSRRCYYCPFFRHDCAGIDASVDGWVDWLDKTMEG